MTSIVTSSNAAAVPFGYRNQSALAQPIRPDLAPENASRSRASDSTSASSSTSVVISISREAQSALNTSATSEKEKKEKSGTGPNDLSEEEQAQVRELKKRDQEVRRHEQAHANVGGQYAGAPNYEYQRGPDGQNYAVGGHVSIDVAPVNGDPEATIRKMDIVKRAALAPAEPSPADRSVAAQADATRLQAMAELARERAAGTDDESSSGDASQNDLKATEYTVVAAASARGTPPGKHLNIVA